MLPQYDLIHQLTAAQLAARLPDTAKVLVVGCGTGTEIVQLAALHPAWHFTGVDLSADMLNVAQGRCVQLGIQERVTLQCGQLTTLPSTPSHDAALLILVMHFLPDQGEKRDMLDHIVQRLKPGAPLVLVDLMEPADSMEREALRHACSQLGMDDDMVATMMHKLEQDFYPLSTPRLATLLAESGFQVPVRFFQSLGIHGMVAHTATC
ncbi:class I SAM-dependent methyltransferase [Chitinivorax sp. B]|uniref:class I SAM-dependent methyltransferase n=1 Tax=Chitinivorax sp. B TaxID=2502235 RepID=UPI0010F9A803|nr:class I SAM-dependent methyltransferase [Chitinivorax sp. B]